MDFVSFWRSERMPLISSVFGVPVKVLVSSVIGVPVSVRISSVFGVIVDVWVSSRQFLAYL